MKRASTLIAILAVLALAGAPVLLAGEAKAESTWTGWITDANCGAKNANADGKACALACFKKGSRLVLYNAEEKKTYDLDQQEAASQNLGYEVKVTGTMEEGKIKVSRIEENKKG